MVDLRDQIHTGIRGLRKSAFVAFASTFFLLPTAALPQGTGVAQPQELQLSIVSKVVAELTRFTQFGSPNFVVSRELRPETTVLPADQVTFTREGRLVFARIDEPLAVITQRVVFEGIGKSEITWAREPRITQAPPARQKAANGTHGISDGQDGRAGANGSPGNLGFSGKSAPDAFLIFGEVGDGELTLDFRGQDGGEGGRGQDGGDGGNGARGSDAAASLFDCKRGAGRGGDGGDGGLGGPGGEGGSGGDGGNVVVIVPRSKREQIISRLRVLASGGAGGYSGEQGSVGAPGKGGPPGNPAPPYCRSEPDRVGRGGKKPEQATAPAAQAPSGQPGTFYIVEVEDDQFSKIVFPTR